MNKICRMGILVRVTILLFVFSTSDDICSTTTSDLPILMRSRYAINISTFDLNKRMLGHVDIPDLLIANQTLDILLEALKTKSLVSFCISQQDILSHAPAEGITFSQLCGVMQNWLKLRNICVAHFRDGEEPVSLEFVSAVRVLLMCRRAGSGSSARRRTSRCAGELIS